MSEKKKLEELQFRLTRWPPKYPYCETCQFWKRLDNYGNPQTGARACHHLYDTGHRKQDDGTSYKSYIKRCRAPENE